MTAPIHDYIDDQIEFLDLQSSASSAEHDGGVNRLSNAQQDRNFHRAEYGIYQEQVRHGEAPYNEAIDAQHKKHDARTQRAVDDAQSALTEITKRSSSDRAILERSRTFRLKVNLDEYRIVPATVIKGDPRKVLDSAMADQEDGHATIKDAKGAPPLMKDVLAKALAGLDTLRRNPLPDVDVNGDLVWDRTTHFINADGNEGWTAPHSFDARVFFLSDPANYEKAKARIKEQLERHYASMPKPMTEAERSKLISAARAKILDAERREVAAIRALRDAGQRVAFRPNTDLRAVLGIDGPPIKSR